VHRATNGRHSGGHGPLDLNGRPNLQQSSNSATSLSRLVTGSSQRLDQQADGAECANHQYCRPHDCRVEAVSAAQVWRQSSRDRMVHIIESRIIPKFGQQPLAALRRSEVQGWAFVVNRA
jgi:hypothetical protein